ncbi:MAG TPA: sensor histidine kinase [Bacteroidales bacterium]|nr:sensor histidine kinase [Bacteroidales bacterium]
MKRFSFDRIRNIGVKASHNFDEVKEIRLMNVFNFCTAMVGISYTTLLLLMGNIYLAAFDFAIAVFAVIAILLNYFKLHKSSTFFTFLFLPILLIAIAYVYGGAGCEFYLFPFIVILAYLKKPIKTLSFFLVLYIISFLIIKYLEMTIEVEPDIAMIGQYFLYTNISASIILLFLFIRLFIIEYEENRKILDSKNIELEERNNELIEKNKKIEILLSEISHRTKNNLQLISSLINLQSNEISDGQEKSILNDVKSRIYTIALVHKKLYLSSRSNEIMMSDYIQELAMSIIDSMSREQIKFSLIDNSDNKYINIDDAVSIGIIINELVTNSIEHGLQGVGNKEIKIFLESKTSTDICLIYSDSGRGINVLNDVRKHGFGFSLVVSMLEQLEADYQIYEENGNYIKICVNLKVNEKDIIN